MGTYEMPVLPTEIPLEKWDQAMALLGLPTGLLQEVATSKDEQGNSVLEVSFFMLKQDFEPGEKSFIRAKTTIPVTGMALNERIEDEPQKRRWWKW